MHEAFSHFQKHNVKNAAALQSSSVFPKMLPLMREAA